MANELYSVGPPDSQVLLSPYTQRLLHSGTDSRIVLSRATNYLLKSFSRGHDEANFPEGTSNIPDYDARDSCILDGLNTSFELEGSLFIVTVSPGTLIVDDTLLIFPKETYISLDLDNNELGTFGDQSACGPIVLSVNYKWIGSLEEDAPTLRLNYQRLDNGALIPNEWQIPYDKLIITVFSWGRDGSGDIDPSSFVNWNPTPMSRVEPLVYNINHHPYEVGPLPKMYHALSHAIDNRHPRKVSSVITNSDWSGDELPPFETAQSHIYADIDTTSLSDSKPMVQCFVEDMMVSPAGIQFYDSNTIRIWMPSTFTNDPPAPDMDVVIVG